MRKTPEDVGLKSMSNAERNRLADYIVDKPFIRRFDDYAHYALDPFPLSPLAKLRLHVRRGRASGELYWCVTPVWVTPPPYVCDIWKNTSRDAIEAIKATAWCSRDFFLRGP